MKLRRTITPLALAAVAVLGAGCSIFRSEPGGVLTATSGDGTKSLAPNFTTAAYMSTDADTADVYLSDIPRERFADPRDSLAGADGSIMHLHIFMVPEAGQTPIDSTACNLTVRQLVLATAEGAGPKSAPITGLYGGGGFMLPYGTFGSGTISGSINAASHRLTRSAPGFKDLLGPGTLTGRFSAPQDEQLAQQMAAKFGTLVMKLPSVSTEDADLKPAPAKKPIETKPKKKPAEKPAEK